MEQKWPPSLVILRHGQSARNVGKDLAKVAGKYVRQPRDQSAASSLIRTIEITRQGEL